MFMFLRKIRIMIRESYTVFLPLALILFLYSSGYAFINTSEEGVCTQDNESSGGCEDISKIPGDSSVLTPSGEQKTSEPQHIPKENKIQNKSDRDHAVASKPSSGKTNTAGFYPDSKSPVKHIIAYLFWGKGCPHCAEEKIFLQNIKRIYPGLIIKDYEVWYNKENASLLSKMVTANGILTSGVPVTFIGRDAFVGFSRQIKEEIEESLHKCSLSECVDPFLVTSGEISSRVLKDPKITGEKNDELACKQKSNSVYIPWLGNLDASEMSLPVITLIIAGLDSFNPCAFFVLFSLLGLLIHAQSRTKMFLIGIVFVFFSGFIYFLFMAAWLNLFLFMGQVEILTMIAGSIAILFALINIKDFFIFKKGLSLTIPDGAKPKLFDRMRRLLKSTSLVSILVGTAVLAIAANSYELLCTAGFPMVFTRILTLNKLTSLSYYLYLVLYNLIYIVPLAVIVVIFTITLGRRQLTEWQGRILKLVSGTMMLVLGGALIFDPTILSNAFVSFFLIIGALVVSAIVIFLTKRLR
jgi:glutaredoxin